MLSTDLFHRFECEKAMQKLFCFYQELLQKKKKTRL